MRADLFRSHVSLMSPLPIASLVAQLSGALARFNTERRLFTLCGSDAVADLLVEGWSAQEALSELSVTRILCLSTNARLNLDKLLGQAICLQTALADGSRGKRSGLIAHARMLGSEGGFARVELIVLPWLWWTTLNNHNRIFQDKTLLEIITEVLRPYASIGTWQSATGMDAFLTDARVHSRCSQYRETDYDFLTRLLAEEGLGYCFIEDDQAPCGHSLHLFARGADLPEDYSAAHQFGGAGIRYHRGHSQEEQDAIQALGSRRRLDATVATALSWDYKRHRALTANVPTHHVFGGQDAPVLEAYDHAGLYAWANAAQAQRYTTLAMEAREARYKYFFGHSTVRTFQPGTRWQLTQSTLDELLPERLNRGHDGKNPANDQTEASGPGLSREERRTFLTLSVLHAGINNLPGEAQEAIAQLLGQHPLPAPLPATGSGTGVASAVHSSGTLRRDTCFPDLDQDLYADPWTPSWPEDALQTGALPSHPSAQGPASTLLGLLGNDSDWNPGLPRASALNHPHPLHEAFPQVLAQAQATGYGNAFTAQRAAIPWRPLLADETGLYHRPRATAPGVQTAIVIGPNGETTPNGADELYTDQYGRVCIRPHWTESGAFLWVRVTQRQAGPGMGAQFIPRIGTEVLVDFLEGDIDRPIIIASLYNGQGEGGVTPTPGGKESPQDAQASDALYAKARDQRPSAQGNLAGGMSPPWHGASPDDAGHRNNAALSGIKTKEFGGEGYNQLVFDDTDNQLRIQLATTQASTQLNLGHLIHQADNYRGSFRGEGWEARTDAYLALRGGRGVMITSFGQEATDKQMWRNDTPAGDFTAGQALLKQIQNLGDAFSGAAATHQTVKLAAKEGSTKTNQSIIDHACAPLVALEKVARGMVSDKALDTALSDATAKHTAAQKDALPHLTDPIVTLAARAGYIQVSGQDSHIATGETHTQASGGHTVHHTMGQHKLHTGQAIGVLAGATKAGENGLGLQLIAAKDPLQLQAQSDEIKLLAKDALKLASQRSDVTLAAPQEILIRNGAGSYIRIAGGNIEVRCPGTLTIHAASKALGGGGQLRYELTQFPQSPLNIQYAKRVRVSS